MVDTFRVDADGLTSLACVYLGPVSDAGAPVAPKGTAILLHDESQDRNAMLPLTGALLDSGFAVCLYDQRASGRSTGAYHSDGEYEAADLSEVIAFMRGNPSGDPRQDEILRPIFLAHAGDGDPLCEGCRPSSRGAAAGRM